MKLILTFEDGKSEYDLFKSWRTVVDDVLVCLIVGFHLLRNWSKYRYSRGD